MVQERPVSSARHSEMTHRERVQAALLGQPVDRTPISLWHHFPGRDNTGESLAANTVESQRRLDLDFIKLMPTGMYSVMDYGVQVRVDAVSGTTRFVSGPIREAADWGRLPEVSPNRGMLKEGVDVVRRVREALGPDTPVIQTIFSPLTMAAKIVGGELIPVIEESEEQLRGALEKFAQDVADFGSACLKAGADGFFFATQQATRGALPEDVFERLGVAYDLQVLEALRDGSWCTLLHLHGANPLFELADRYPVNAVNWHDRESPPSLKEGLSLTKRGLVGGIQRTGAVLEGSPEEVAQEVRDAVAQVDGQRLIVGPSCVIPMGAPFENLLAARRAVDAP